MKTYVRKGLQPDEEIVITGRLHWTIYLFPIVLFVMAALVSAFAYWVGPDGELLYYLAGGIFVVAIGLFVRSWFVRWITELTVTNRRVVYGQSFIFRNTVEMNIDKIESVRVDQSVIGRLLGYGTIHILGTGQGIEHLHHMGSPLEIRNAIIS